MSPVGKTELLETESLVADANGPRTYPFRPRLFRSERPPTQPDSCKMKTDLSVHRNVNIGTTNGHPPPMTMPTGTRAETVCSLQEGVLNLACLQQSLNRHS